MAPVPRSALIFAVAFLAGTINAVAGGGTVLSFPVLVWLGLPPVTANATNAVGLWPGTFGSAWGFRREIASARPTWLWLALPSLVGGALGAWLLVHTPPRFFASIAPYLVLGSAMLVAVEPMLRQRLAIDRRNGRTWMATALLLQLVIALYGGYFGAGIGIMLITSLGLLGVESIHRANGLKSLFSIAIKGVAVGYFIVAGAIVWSAAAAMAAGALLGGWGGAVAGRRVGERPMRWAVVAIGIIMSVVMLLRA